ncbi:hypothetical protein Salat_2661500 [Sesamum alatum]|uniref:Reverse transcriptase zinc-binding domain-containing protein n=1 Tax=Sesamum alatum TaxID=300844 RepID=A0AAE1XPE1_9LAMI|nr:hypothetical protein Salat_2661500 [Sesamum alatum]
MRDRAVSSLSGLNLLLSRGWGSVWMAIWRVRVLPKMRLSMWRLCVRALPMLEGLVRWRTGVDTECPVCGAGVESLGHIMVLQRLTKEERVRFVAFAWAIRKHRCRKLMEGKDQSSVEAWQRLLIMLDSY